MRIPARKKYNRTAPHNTVYSARFPFLTVNFDELFDISRLTNPFFYNSIVPQIFFLSRVRPRSLPAAILYHREIPLYNSYNRVQNTVRITTTEELP
jgi:hypothetical protein